MIHMFQFLFLVSFIAIVFGSAFTEIEEIKEIEEINSFQREVEHEINVPEKIKAEFVTFAKQGLATDCENMVNQYPFLISYFNRDIFSGVILCFNDSAKEQDCWKIFRLIEPSFANVKRSISTPLIMALRDNNMVLVKELLKLKSVKDTIDQVDEFSRTALMYVAKRGNIEFAQDILKISTESINAKDFMDKSALHYACEMNPIGPQPMVLFKLSDVLLGKVSLNESQKLDMAHLLVSNGAKIDYHGAEFKFFNFVDRNLKDFIISNGGKVSIIYKPEDIVIYSGFAISLSEFFKVFGLTKFGIYVLAKLFYIFLANPMMMDINNVFFFIQQIFLPGMDLNFVVSFDLGNGFQDFSFNLLFILFLAWMIKGFNGQMNTPNVFKF